MNIILYFGSFNPIHKGHIAITEYMASNPQCDALWLIVSPHNPLKEMRNLADEQSRFEMVKIGFSDSKYKQKILISDIEFSLPKPSYTINTLEYLKEKYPTYKFSILIGEDHLSIFKEWKDWEKIITNYTLLVYPREGNIDKPTIKHKNIVMLHDAPLSPFNSTAIRESIKTLTNLETITTEKIAEYIKINKLYE